MHLKSRCVLLDTARDAELLVVGSRHRGAMAELLPGSGMRAFCVRHAGCPVVVVP